jgi:two-component system response regulator GlrR
MKEVKVAFLDFDPGSGLGDSLKSILQEYPSLAIQVCQETIPTDEPHPQRTISRFLETLRGELIFLILPSTRLEEARLFLRTWRKSEVQAPVIGIVEGAKPDEAKDLLRMGMLDFITPPLKAVDVLPRILRIVERRPSDEILLNSLKTKIGLTQLVGKSPAFRTEMDKIPLIANCDASVLIFGETGTGKELFARAIHYLGNRRGKPFVPVSCGAIPMELIENELFGHVRGAFTGAATSQIGLVGEAEGGTLFLDDINCLPLLAQVKVLRLLQEKEYKQLGSTIYHHANVRVIAATNVDLENAVKEAKFRQDLFYRLNVIPLALPPLRERKEDIPLLARHFLEEYAFEFKKETKDFNDEAMQKLLAYDWPGNVREMQNVIERAVVFSPKSAISPEVILLPTPEAAPHESFKAAKWRAVMQFERKYIEGLLVSCEGNISKAARAAEKNRRAFWELIRKHKIQVEGMKSNIRYWTICAIYMTNLSYPNFNVPLDHNIRDALSASLFG